MAQSLIPVFHRDYLTELLDVANDTSQAEALVKLLTWNPDRPGVFDAMYQPLIEMADGYYMFPLNILGSADLVRNALSLRQLRLSSPGNDPLGQWFQKILASATSFASSERKYKHKGEDGELDTIAMIEDVLFVFECKNSLHPCSTFELRTSFDHIVGASEQLNRFLRLWQESDFQQDFGTKLGWDLSRVKQVVTAVITGNRMFGGLQVGGHPVRSFYEVGNFILSGEITIFGTKVRLRPEGPLTADALRSFISDDPLHEKIFTAMIREDESVALSGATISIEDYKLNPHALAREFGVPAPSDAAESHAP